MALAGTLLILHRIQSSPLVSTPIVVLEAIFSQEDKWVCQSHDPTESGSKKKTLTHSFPFMALNKSGNANDRKYPKPKEDI